MLIFDSAFPDNPAGFSYHATPVDKEIIRRSCARMDAAGMLTKTRVEWDNLVPRQRAHVGHE